MLNGRHFSVLLAAQPPTHLSAMLPSTSSSAVVTLDEVRGCRFRQFRKSSDVVAQFTHLSKLSVLEADPAIFSELSATVIHALPKLNGEDLATILKSCVRMGFRDELMIVAICESIRTLSQLRLLRISNISALLDSFHKLNVVPSVGALNVLAKETKRSLVLYKSRNLDVCKLFRYFSILQQNPTIAVQFDRFQFPDITHILQQHIEDRIGMFGPSEIAIVTKHCKSLSLERLILNFSRSENVRPQLLSYFLRNLDARFGKNCWKEFEHLFRATDTDSTGWGRSSVSGFPDLDSDDEDELVPKNDRVRFPLLQLDDGEIAQLVKRVPKLTTGRTVQFVEPRSQTPPEFTIDRAQMDALDLLEEEVRPMQKRQIHPYSDRNVQRVRRKQETAEFLAKGLARNRRKAQNFKAQRNRRLFKFAILSYLR